MPLKDSIGIILVGISSKIERNTKENLTLYYAENLSKRKDVSFNCRRLLRNL